MSPARPARPPRLYALADLDSLGEQRLEAAVRAMAEAGVGWIQLRLKGASGAQAARLTERCQAAVSSTAATLWIDDRVDIAACYGLAGVHVGQQDLPAKAARRALGAGPWIGVSTHDESQVAAAAADPAVDVIAIGPVFATRSKQSPGAAVGLDMVRRARARTDKVLVAIGGIDAGNAASVLAAGADTVAVLGAICRGDSAENAHRLVAAVAV